jgi:hypothetical protein
VLAFVLFAAQLHYRQNDQICYIYTATAVLVWNHERKIRLSSGLRLCCHRLSIKCVTS